MADYLAVYVDKKYIAPQDAGGIGRFWERRFFAVQICVISGYTDIARGAARMMGIRLMENFRHPYQRSKYTGFLEKMAYQPDMLVLQIMYIFHLEETAEGLQRMPQECTDRFSAEWIHSMERHGILLYRDRIHGIYMVSAIYLSQIRKDKKRILHPVAGWILTLLLVNIAWVFFRAPSLIGAWRILQQPLVNPLGSGIAETMS